MLIPAAWTLRSGRHRLVSAAFVLGLFWSADASALDVFSLWRQPQLEIDIFAGAWVEYRTQKIESGRQAHDYIRVQCIADTGKTWTIEILPMQEAETGNKPIPGEGWRFHLSHELLKREGDLVDHIDDVIHWQAGRANAVPEEQWREDPLITTSLKSGFRIGTVNEDGRTTRVVSGVEFVCRQFTITDVDTGRVRLPRGELVQIHRDEFSVAIHADIPFLGVAYAAQRSSTRSAFNPPGRGRRVPAPSTRVEIMELTGFGQDAIAVLNPR